MQDKLSSMLSQGLIVVMGLCLGMVSQGADLSLTPKSLDEARDIVEVRKWLWRLRDHLITYRGRQVQEHGLEALEPSNVVWPVPDEFDAVLRIGEDALTKEQTDWETLCYTISCAVTFTPVDARLESLAIRVIKTKLPPEIDGNHWSLLSDAMRVLAKQDSVAGRELLVSSVSAKFWEGADSVYKESTKLSDDPRAATRSILRRIALDSIAHSLKPNDGVAILENLKTTETDDAILSDAIAGALEIAKARREGKPLPRPDEGQVLP